MITDGRRAARSKHHRAIIDAARTLATTSGLGFTVDQVAEAAEVSRRTVYNHFASLDELHRAVGDDIIADLIEDVLARVADRLADAHDPHAVVDAVCSVVQEVDLADAIAVLTTILGLEPHSPAAHAVADSAFERAGGRVLALIVDSDAGIDPLDAQLFVSTVMNGVVVIADHWIARCEARLDAESRAVWDDLLDRHLRAVRHGHDTPSGRIPHSDG